MLDGINDSDEDARRLVRLIAGIPAKINLIPFNEWPGAPYRGRLGADRGLCRHRLQGRLCQPDPHAAGEDIMAACGQLKSDSARAPRRRSHARGPLHRRSAQPEIAVSPVGGHFLSRCRRHRPGPGARGRSGRRHLHPWCAERTAPATAWRLDGRVHRGQEPRDRGNLFDGRHWHRGRHPGLAGTVTDHQRDANGP
jgi:hypothetical protein